MLGIFIFLKGNYPLISINTAEYIMQKLEYSQILNGVELIPAANKKIISF